VNTNTPSHANWFETFFEGIAVDLWSEVVKNVPSAAEVDYLERQLGKKPGATILDVPCGAGRHSLELARRGYEVVGIDISRESIEAARAAAQAANLNVDFRWADMRSVSGSFDAAFCFGNSFGYLPHADTKQFLSALAKSLKPGSSFVLQTGVVAESLLPNFRKEAWYEIGDIGFRIRNTYELENSALQTEYSFTRNGKTETRLGWQSVYSCGELCRMFADAGLNVVHLHQNIEGQPYEVGAQTLLLTAQRPG
jgi:SAM-dependent methyltransferase